MIALSVILWAVALLLWTRIIRAWLRNRHGTRALFRLPWAYTKPPTWNPADWRRWSKRTAYELTWAGGDQPDVGCIFPVDAIMNVKVLAAVPGRLVVIQVR